MATEFLKTLPSGMDPTNDGHVLQIEVLIKNNNRKSDSKIASL